MNLNIYDRQTFIHVRTPFLKKKTKQLDSSASICIFKAKVCSVCSYYGKSNQAIKLQRCMRLPGGNFQGLEKKKRLAVNNQTLFSFFPFNYRRIWQPTLSRKQINLFSEKGILWDNVFYIKMQCGVQVSSNCTIPLLDEQKQILLYNHSKFKYRQCEHFDSVL